MQLNILLCVLFSNVIVGWWRHWMSLNFVINDSGNGLVPDGTKPLPDPVVTYCQWVLVTFQIYSGGII